jgi:RHS repeat-associated protein
MTTDYVFTDHLGSTRHVADELGVEVASYRYYPFGHYAQMSGAAELPMRYAGHERDERLGLDYMLARYYGSGLGRFLSVDPVTLTAERQQDPQRLNLFAYALNSPVNYRDPSGEDVDVGNRAVGGTLGIGGHSFTIVTPTGANVQKYANRTDPNTGTIHLSGFPVDDPLAGNTVLVGAENDPRDVGNADQVIGIPAPQGTSMEQFESNVIEAFDSYQNNQPYAILPGAGEFNSNSLTSGLLTAGGAEQIPDRGALDRFNPGWDTPVPLPDATADDSPQQQRTP